MKNRILHKKDIWWKPPYNCWNCGEPSGFGFGKEPMRYDIAWCSSKCWQEFDKHPRGAKKLS